MTNTSKQDFTVAGTGNDLLTYTGNTIISNEGHECKVIDVDATDFSNASLGRKSSVTMVVEAQGGENTAQIFENAQETQWPYIAVAGDAIFVQGDIDACLKYMATGEVDNKHGAIDIYVPDNAKLSETGRLQFQNLEAEGYEVQPQQDGSQTYVKSPSASILEEANTDWACIAYEGKQVKFFPPRSSFKLLDGVVSGINPEAFDETWEVLEGQMDIPSSKSTAEALESPSRK